MAATLEDLAREAVAGDPRDLTRAVIDRSGLRAQALATGGAEGAARLAGLAALERLSGDILRRHVGLDARGLQTSSQAWRTSGTTVTPVRRARQTACRS